MDTDTSLTAKIKALDQVLASSQNIDSLQTKMLYSKCSIYFELQEYDSMLQAGKILTQKATRINDNLNLGKYHHLMAYYHENISSSLDSAFYYNHLSKNNYLKIPDSTRALKRLIRMAILQNIGNDYFGAKETLTEAIRYTYSPTQKGLLVDIYSELASNYRKLMNHSEAIRHYSLAIDGSNSKLKVVGYKNNLATVLQDLGKYKEAVEVLNSILIDSTLKKSTTTYARIIDNLAYSQWKNGNKNTVSQFLKALKIRIDKKDKRGQIASYTHLGEYFYQTSPHRSKKYLDTAIQVSKQLKIPKAETDALGFLMNLEPKNISFRNRYIFLKDSMYNNELKVKTQFAKMKYDDEQEKTQILELETEASQKRAQLAEQKTQKVIYLFLSAFLLLSGISLYFVLKQKHTKEKLQEVYNTEKRISQDLHDGLANDVFGLMTKVQIQDKGNEELLSRLEDIYQTTRQISHENAAIKTGIYFKNELNALISNYQSGNTTVLIKGISAIEWPQLSEHKCVIIHRSIKELLVNMKKHSQASLVSLQFKNSNNNLVITYSDNGVGFNSKKSNGIGLMNTGNRIRSIKGDLTFEKKQGPGAKAIITIPFK